MALGLSASILGQSTPANEGLPIITPSITSPAGQNLTLGTGSFGTAVTFASATGAATFAGGVVGTGATGGSQGAGSGNFAALYVNGVAVGTSTGNVSTTGTPAANQITFFSSGTVIQSSANATLTTGGAASFASTVSSGAGVFANVSNIGVNSTDGIVLQNTTSAALNAQQWSPRAHWIGHGWATSGSANQTVQFWAEVQPIQGAANATGNWVLSSQVGGGAAGAVLSVTNGGNLVVTNVVEATNGSVSAASYNNAVTSGAVNTGLYFPSNTTVGITANGTQALSASSSAVAIPLPLTVTGQLSVAGGIVSSGSGISNGLTNNGTQAIIGPSSATALWIVSNNTVAITVATNQAVTFANTVTLAAATTSLASLVIPSGAAPTSPSDGMMWYDGTNVKFRVGAVTKTFTLT